MKTLTEFSAFHLREAQAKHHEIRAALNSEGKPADELEQAVRETLQAFLTEKFKLEAERLDLFLKALEVAQAKPRELENLKRVVVYGVGEGEKVPGHLIHKDAHAFGAEYLASLRPQKQQDRRDSGSKHGKGKGKGRGKRRGDLKGKRPDGGAERRGAGAPGESTGQRRDAAGGPRPDGGKGPRRDGRPGRGPRRDEKTSGPRQPRQDLPPGHVSVDQAARALKSTGIRPVAKPAAAPTAPSDSGSSISS